MLGDFGNDFSKAFFGTDNLRDYTHGSKVFRSNNYALAPRQKFLFHVAFNLNTGEIPQLAKVFAGKQSTLSLLVKTAQLPTYQIDVEEMNQYNRKRMIQKKITYQPVQLTLHDDSSDLSRTLWYNYFSYYYKDPTHGYNTGDRNGFNARDIYNDKRVVNDWGFTGDSFSGGPKPAFFKDITIYGLSQKKYAAYVLINPIITDWVHDTYSYQDTNDTIGNTMTIRYETVKYYDGANGYTVPGFGAESHYDKTPSGLTRGGTSANILGAGGLLSAGGSIASDLEEGSIGSLLNAVRTAGTTANTFKGKDFGGILKSEAVGLLSETAKETLQGSTTSEILNTQVSSLVPSLGGFGFPRNLSSGISSVQNFAKPVDLFGLSATTPGAAPSTANPGSYVNRGTTVEDWARERASRTACPGGGFSGFISCEDRARLNNTAAGKANTTGSSTP